MAKVLLLIKWTFRMWPVLLPIALAIIHYLIATNCPADLSHANKIISLILQIVGGIIVLYSIDSNLGITNKTSLFSILFFYLKSFPLFKRSVTLNVDSARMKMTGHPPKVRVSGPTNTTQEKIDYLKQQIEWLKEDMSDEVKNLKGMLSNAEERTNASITEIRRSIGNIDHKVTELSVGGIKTQIFGVLLMIYGSVVSYYT